MLYTPILLLHRVAFVLYNKKWRLNIKHNSDKKTRDEQMLNGKIISTWKAGGSVAHGKLKSNDNDGYSERLCGCTCVPWFLNIA